MEERMKGKKPKSFLQSINVAIFVNVIDWLSAVFGFRDMLAYLVVDY